MKRIYGISLFGVIVLSVAWNLFDGGSKVDQWRFYHFDQTQWRDATASQRYFMSEYLCDNQLLFRRTRADVLDILGDGTIPSESPTVLRYDLGRKRGLEMSGVPRLIIKFDQGNLVEESRVVSSS